MIIAFQIGVVGGQILGSPQRRGLLRRPPQLDFEHIHDGLRDLVLDREDVGHLAIVALRPQVAAVGDGDQLRGHAQAIARLPHAALQNVRDAQRIANTADVFILALESEGRGPRRHLQPRQFRQCVDDLLGEPVAEVLVVLVAAHVGEGQHSDRGSLFRRSEFDGFQHGLHFRHGLIAIRRGLAQAALDDALDLRRPIQPLRLLVQDRRHGRDGSLTTEGSPSTEHLVEHQAEGKNVGASIGRLAFGLFRRHISRGADNAPRLRLGDG